MTRHGKSATAVSDFCDRAIITHCITHGMQFADCLETGYSGDVRSCCDNISYDC